MTGEPAWRPARAADAPDLHALVRRAYRGPGGWTNEIGRVEGERISLAALHAAIADPGAILVVVPESSEPAAPDSGGILACCEVRADPSGLAHLGLLAVTPARQRGRLGRGLIALARRLAVERFAAPALEITVVSGQDALIAWYERRGFRATGEVRPFGDDPRDRPLVPGLHFVVMHATLEWQGAPTPARTEETR